MNLWLLLLVDVSSSDERSQSDNNYGFGGITNGPVDHVVNYHLEIWKQSSRNIRIVRANPPLREVRWRQGQT